MRSTALSSTRTRSNRPVELPGRTRPNPPRAGTGEGAPIVLAAPPAPVPVDTPTTDRDALIAAHQAGLITVWKHDGERGYRLVMGGRQDQYVEAARLAKHPRRLAGAS
jgi:hypothetical protein